MIGAEKLRRFDQCYKKLQVQRQNGQSSLNNLTQSGSVTQKISKNSK